MDDPGCSRHHRSHLLHRPVTRTECDHCAKVFDPDGPHVEVFDYVVCDDQDDDADPVEVREIGLDFCSWFCALTYGWKNATADLKAGLDQL